MTRRRYLITYDITSDRRRTKVFKYLQGQGDHLQYSVFLCDLDRRELIDLRSILTSLIHHLEDQILIADLGPAHRLPEATISTLGVPYIPTSPVLII